jgi:hypothetical protein
MILATSGYDFIDYNRIISSIISPYTVNSDESKTFRDPNAYFDRRIRGLFIVDKNKALALINEVWN